MTIEEASGQRLFLKLHTMGWHKVRNDITGHYGYEELVRKNKIMGGVDLDKVMAVIKWKNRWLWENWNKGVRMALNPEPAPIRRTVGLQTETYKELQPFQTPPTVEKLQALQGRQTVKQLAPKRLMDRILEWCERQMRWIIWCAVIVILYMLFDLMLNFKKVFVGHGLPHD